MALLAYSISTTNSYTLHTNVDEGYLLCISHEREGNGQVLALVDHHTRLCVIPGERGKRTDLNRNLSSSARRELRRNVQKF